MFDLYDVVSSQQLFSPSKEVKWWSKTKICELLWTHVFFFSLHLELDEHGEHDLTILPSWSMSKLLGLFSISLILLWSTHLVNNMLRDPWPVEVLLETRGFPFHVCFKQNAVIKTSRWAPIWYGYRQPANVQSGQYLHKKVFIKLNK